MENKIIIDGTNATLGRLSSYAAKQALLGKEVAIVNAGSVVIVGRKEDIVRTHRPQNGSKAHYRNYAGASAGQCWRGRF